MDTQTAIYYSRYSAEQKLDLVRLLLPQLSIEQQRVLFQEQQQYLEQQPAPAPAPAIKEVEGNKVLFDYKRAADGGWCKSVTGIDKQFTNGYSIEGPFMPDQTAWYLVGHLYLECAKYGRRNHTEDHILFYVDADGNDHNVCVVEDRLNGWATQLWEPIQAYWTSHPEFAPAGFIAPTSPV